MTSKDISRSVGVYVKNNKRKQPDTLEDLEEKINKIQKYIFKAFELKARNISNYVSNIGLSGDVECLMHVITRGVGETLRIGDQILVKLIEYRIYIEVSTLSTNTLSGYGSISIVQDKVPTGTAPTAGQIYDLLANPTSFIINEYKNKYKELREHFFTYGTGTINSKGQIFEGHIDINQVTQYTGNAGSQTDMTNGANDYLIVARSSNTSIGNESYGYVIILRIYYLDA